MAARFSKFFRSAHLVGDVLLLNFAFFVGNAIYYNNLTISFNDHYIKQFLYINLFWAVATSFVKVYGIYRVMRFESIFILLLRAFFLHLLLIFAFVVIFKEYLYFHSSYKLFAVKYLAFAISTTGWRIGFLYLLKVIRKQGLNFRNVIILGTGPIAQEAYNFFVKHPEHGYRFLGFFHNAIHQEKDTNIFVNNKESLLVGSINEVKKFSSENNVDEIYCSFTDLDNETIQDLMEFADDNLIRFKLLPDFRGFMKRRVEVNFYDDVPVLIIRKEPLDNIGNRLAKRFFDIIFSLLVILLIFPWLIPIIAISIKLSSKGPVFFKQLRSGRNNHPFYCHKFRSMYMNGTANDLQATKDDPRITGIGKLLRKTSLDEVPQFFNVLMGNMSVVGPRPHMLQHTEQYSKIVDSFMVRHFVKPGITGFAQVKGFRGETTDPVLMEKRIQNDLWYIENWSLLLDIKIILLTIWNMLKGDKNAI